MAKKKINQEEFVGIKTIELTEQEREELSQLGFGAFVSRDRQDRLSRELSLGFAMMDGEPVNLR